MKYGFGWKSHLNLLNKITDPFNFGFVDIARVTTGRSAVNTYIRLYVQRDTRHQPLVGTMMEKITRIIFIDVCLLNAISRSLFPFLSAHWADFRFRFSTKTKKKKCQQRITANIIWITFSPLFAFYVIAAEQKKNPTTRPGFISSPFILHILCIRTRAQKRRKIYFVDECSVLLHLYAIVQVHKAKSHMWNRSCVPSVLEWKDAWKKLVINDDDYNVILPSVKKDRSNMSCQNAGCFRVIRILVADVRS